MHGRKPVESICMMRGESAK